MPGLFIGADHRGFEKKNKLLAALAHIEDFPLETFDLGPYTYIEDDDYNDIAVTVSRSVLRNPNSFGVLLCGSGVGVSIQANRMKGIRAFVANSPAVVKLAREHNDANIICLSADNLTVEDIVAAIRIFISTKFSGAARHARRNSRLDEDIKL